MKLPKMILFDNGGTLMTVDPDFDSLRVTRAIIPHIIKNPLELTAEQIDLSVQEVFREIQPLRAAGFELHEWMLAKLAYGRLGIEFDISMAEFERIIWDEMSPGAITPNIDKLIDYLNTVGIRTGVVSNVVFSGQALSDRLNRLIPNNEFEFVIASSEYAVRKPNISLFLIAAFKSGLSSDQIWYCGDNMANDVIGSHNAGMFPVLYEGIRPNNRTANSSGPNEKEDFDFLRISDWEEMIEILKSAKE